MVIQAGRYRTRLIMEQDTAGTQAADGYQEPVWTEIARPWCRVRPLDGREVQLYAAMLSDQPVIIECRYDKRFAAVNPTGWRLTNTAGDVAYDILSGVNKDMRNEEWLFLCRAGSTVPTA